MTLRCRSIALVIVTVITAVCAIAAVGAYWVSAKMTFADVKDAEILSRLSLWKVYSKSDFPGIDTRESDQSWSDATDPEDAPFCTTAGGQPQKGGPTNGDIRKKVHAADAMMILNMLACFGLVVLAILVVVKAFLRLVVLAAVTVVASLLNLIGIAIFASVYHACDKNFCDSLYDALVSAGFGQLSHTYKCGPDAGMGLAICGLLLSVFVLLPVAFCVHRAAREETEGNYSTVTPYPQADYLGKGGV